MRSPQELYTAIRTLKVAGNKEIVWSPLAEAVDELVSLRAYLADLSRFMVHKDHVRTLMTDKQKEVLDFIRSYTMEHNRPPALGEIATALDKSSTTVFEHIGVLIRRGLIVKVPNKTRGLFLTGAALVIYGDLNDQGEYAPEAILASEVEVEK